jgi:hypothetical protein
MTASAKVGPPPSATRWIAAVSSADFINDPQLPIGVYVATGASIVVVRGGVSMTISATGVTYVVPTSLGTVTGTCHVLYQS